jgi:hypothetical protein
MLTCPAAEAAGNQRGVPRSQSQLEVGWAYVNELALASLAIRCPRVYSPGTQPVTTMVLYE